MFRVLLSCCTKSATKAGSLSEPMLVESPNLGTISLSRHRATSDALSVQVGKASAHPENVHTMITVVTVVSVRFHFSEVHSQVFKGQRAFQLNTREAALTCEQAAWPRWVAWCVWLIRVAASSSGTNNLPLGNSHHPFSVLMAPSALAS